LVCVLGHPLLHLVGSMHRMKVHDEKDFAWHRAHQAAQVVAHHLSGQLLPTLLPDERSDRFQLG
jgi:hypothetical protein